MTILPDNVRRLRCFLDLNGVLTEPLAELELTRRRFNVLIEAHGPMNTLLVLKCHEDGTRGHQLFQIRILHIVNLVIDRCHLVPLLAHDDLTSLLK